MYVISYCSQIYTNTYFIYISDTYICLVFVFSILKPCLFCNWKGQGLPLISKGGRHLYSLPSKLPFNLWSDYLDFGYSMKSKCELTKSSVNWCAYFKDDLSLCLMCLGYQCCLRIFQWLFILAWLSCSFVEQLSSLCSGFADEVKSLSRVRLFARPRGL